MTIAPLPFIDDALTRSPWTRTHTLPSDARLAALEPAHALPVSDVTKRYLTRAYPHGVYRHQAIAARHAAEFHNFVVATGTASGKTLCFHVAALEQLVTTPDARVIVLYPQKALGVEQEERWRAMLSAAGVPASVGRIDGQVPLAERERLLSRCRVLILTPDVMHAWLLANLAKKAIAKFVRDTRLIITDEVHTFTGVFGSNVAYLFRRFEHAQKLMTRKRLQVVCASATIADPKGHLKLLFDRDFDVIGPEQDGSEKHPVTLHLLTPSGGAKDLLSNTAALLASLARAGLKFLCFSDSRKQTENLASIAARAVHDDDDDDEADAHLQKAWLDRLRVLPFRSGYELRDRSEIQDRLTRGDLDGVIATSALELGLDIPHLDVVVLVGVPTSSTSFQQRVGRVGRRQPGHVLILDTGSASDRALFAEPSGILRRPPASSALYLENANIACIHALCLARPGGEHDAVLHALGRADSEDFDTNVSWPDGFSDLVHKERAGTLPPALQNFKTQGGEHPNVAFPLRDVETSFKVELHHAHQPTPLGTLSYSQVMREAYPGAVYLYATRAYRVTKVSPIARTVHVRPEKRYTTKPACLPTLAYPNFDADAVHHAEARALLSAVDCNVMISEHIVGFSERRGANEFTSSYPLDASRTGIYYHHPRFSRNFFTTGVVLHAPSLQGDAPRGRIAELLLEAFGLVVPFESRDIGVTTDKLRVERPGLSKGDAVIVVYDQTYGSLRLSSKLLHAGVLEETLARAVHLARYALEDADAAERAAWQRTLDVLADLAGHARMAATPTRWTETPRSVEGSRVRVITPDSVGLCVLHGNREFQVQHVYFSPRGGLQYKGRLATDHAWDTHVTVVPVEGVQPIPGLSRLGWYDEDLGDVTEDA
ncbi:DEAD/DEAH box helicase [Deinococcus yavapaiensis]|uniref:DEAD/DEAH box helicase domain-containing protein n=1 Tax=Deinococcus yavapaiensis KR-236 TaxID=694435 RepID=A0A318S8R4_9DEIO|nr:DEAD/DEAH box helicase [Deinococcus yavapaiensis]PYE52032.1 DEAD/DEAH box helicase domain-containing protein [Deinococcus yavapaiensis KR-236]